jgi:hypothetical protein
MSFNSSSSSTEYSYPNPKPVSYRDWYINKLQQQTIPFQSFLPAAQIAQRSKDSFVRDLKLLNGTMNPSSDSKN